MAAFHNIIHGLLFFIFRTSIADTQVSDTCCNLALTSFHLNSSYKCGQVFSTDLTAAPPLFVPLSWCRSNCPGYHLYPASEINAWALPVVQFILPATIFSMTIPRRLGCISLDLRKPFRLLSLPLNLLILTLDTIVWVFIIIIAPTPFIFSGLYEVIIDHKVTWLIAAKTPTTPLTRKEVVQLLTAVLAGNLRIKGVPKEGQGKDNKEDKDVNENKEINPQRELNAKLDIDRDGEDVIQQTMVRLRGMLDGQFPFGATVGVPILLYVSSFIYNLITLRETQADEDTARALAFGIWWMIIVHVAAISSFLLASNNPSTAAATVGRPRVRPTLRQRIENADELDQMEDKIQAKLEAYSRLPLTYNARYEPVWMWSHGKSKMAWLQAATVWNKPWFRELMDMSALGWILLTTVSYSLAFFPCALGYWIEFSTPIVGLGCRALTILVYATSQFVFVILSAWSHFKAVQEDGYWEKHRRLNRLRRPWVGILVAVLFLLPAWIAAFFTTFAGTLLQLSGIFQIYLPTVIFPLTFPQGFSRTVCVPRRIRGRFRQSQWSPWRQTRRRIETLPNTGV